ncbi:MAG: MlaC/ttg2D family ABC transporter substrate-binding protein [Luminiphilus sp.]|nr:ABC transporter substrate-binding protein [Luminiphilus sp.]
MKSVKVMITSALFGLLSLAVTSITTANEATGPTPIIESTTSQIMTIVGEAPDYFDTDPDRFYSEIGSVLDKTIDWRGFAKGVMGEYASNARYRSLDDGGRKALIEQLDSFTDIMKSGLIRTYAKGLLAFSGSKFEIVDDEAVDPNARSASITQLVYGSGDRTYTVRYQMGRSRDGSWRLRNLIVADINLGQIYQNQFAAAAKSANGDVGKVVAEWDISANLPEDLDSE